MAHVTATSLKASVQIPNVTGMHSKTKQQLKGPCSGGHLYTLCLQSGLCTVCVWWSLYTALIEWSVYSMCMVVCITGFTEWSVYIVYTVFMVSVHSVYGGLYTMCF